MSLKSGGVAILRQGGVNSANSVSDGVVTQALTDRDLGTTAPAVSNHCAVTGTKHL